VAGNRRFTDLEYLRAAVIEIMVRGPGVASAIPDASDPAKINIRVNGGAYTADLTNLVNRIRGYPDDDSDKLIADFVAAMGSLKAPSVGEENLVAVFRDKSYVDHISKMPRGPLIEPFVGELSIVYMADLPSSMVVVAKDVMPDKNPDELRTIALGNVRKWLGRIKSDGQLQIATLYFVEDNTMLSPTLILLEEFWISIAARYPGDALIAVPRRDQLFIADDSVQGQALLRRLIDVTFQDKFSLLSRQILARRSGKIVVVEG
jgi:uncharacterized protein YtpQ (UPF0354 family)